jgi:hypothetical protein
MNLQDFVVLLSDEGQAVLNQACAMRPREKDFLRHFQGLARHFPADLARAALETAILRDEAFKSGKFPRADVMYFTRPALEQASSQPVAEYRARRLSGYRHIIDLGCSIGGDTLAFARHASVTGVDIDALRLCMARANAAALDLEERTRFVQADLEKGLPFHPHQAKKGWAIFFDPARRSISGRRVFSIRDYQPPLTIVRDWLPQYPAVCVKISPAVKLAELSPFSEAGLEFISLNGELKEAVLWFGPLRACAHRATLLPEECSLEVAGEEMIPPGLPLSEPLDYLYEPDAAVLRAGLVTLLGVQIDACQLDPDIAYLTGREKVTTHFARVWRVLDWFPFQLKRLRAYLRAHNVGEVVVKKRASPLDPETLIHSLRLEGDEKRTLFLTHLKGKAIVVITEWQ